MTDVRKGQAPDHLARDAFAERFRNAFDDPAFAAEAPAISRLEQIAWEAYAEGRKSPRTRKAGPGYADPDYDLSTEWIATRDKLERAQTTWADPATKSRVLLIVGSPRNDGTCPGEVSKSWRMVGLLREVLEPAGLHIDVLDLSLVTSEYGRNIHPCKSCVSTAMPLCHWPCTCYPNHSLNQVNDWMADIHEQCVAAHAVIIVTPVHWYQSPTPLKAMIDRLVCADGGNPDPTSTHDKKPAENAGWGCGGAGRSAQRRPRGGAHRQGLARRQAQVADRAIAQASAEVSASK